MRRIVISLLPFAVGIVLLVIGIGQITEVHAMRGWPAVTGEVVSVQILQQRQMEGDEPYSAYIPQITYRYQVYESTFEGTRISPGAQPLLSSEDAHAVAARYPVDAEVMVFYDPLNPMDAVLDRGSYAPGAAFTFAGGFFSFCGFVSLIMALRAWWRGLPPDPPYAEIVDDQGRPDRTYFPAR